MPIEKTRPPREQGTDQVQDCRNAPDFIPTNAVTQEQKDAEREALIELSHKIERDRLQRALALAELYDRSPTVAISCRLDLRDLRLLGQEVGRLAFACEVRS